MVVRITFSNIYDPYKQYCEDISIFFEDSSLSKIPKVNWQGLEHT
jgi:hypothetical protein